MAAIAQDTGFQNTRASRLSTDTVRYRILIGALWSIPVFGKIVSIPEQLVFYSTMLAALASIGVILFRPKAMLVALPFFALLSPVAGFVSVLNTRLLLSDLLFPVLAMQLVILVFRMRQALNNPTGWFLPLIVALYLASSMTALLVGTLISLKPMAYVIQLLIIYCYTTLLADSEVDWELTINSWLVAGFLGAILLIHGYMTGTPLADFKYGFDVQAVSRENLTSLFQATYYYTGFHYILGIAIVILFLRLLLSESNVNRLFFSFALGVFVIALIMMMNRTALFSVAISISGILALSLYIRKKTILKTFLLLIAFLTVGAAVLVVSLLQYIGESQSDLWLQRLVGSSPARLEVYVTAVRSWLTFPFQMVVGMGPDFLDGSGEPDLVRLFTFSSLTGATEGTVDSGWLSYLIELGLIGFAVLVAAFIASVRSLIRYLRQIDETMIQNTQALYVLAGLLFVSVALCTQMLGYTKLTWFPFQLLIIGFMHEPRSARKHNKGHRRPAIMAPRPRLRPQNTDKPRTFI